MYFDLDIRLDLDTKIEVSVIRIMVGLVLEINDNSIYIKIALIEWNITVLLKVAMMRFKIRYYSTVVSIIYLIYYLVILIYKDEYSLILYHNYF